jgi:GT2 family glycosyltransferase
MPRVAVNIVTWNSQEYIGVCLEKLFEQTYRDFAITIVDNASTDDSVFIVSKYVNRGVKLIQNATNEGYAPGHNKAIAGSDSEFVLNLNPDIILTSTFLARMVEAIQQDSETGSVAGKLISIAEEQFQAGLPDTLPSGSTIDGAGLLMYKNRRQFLRGHGEDATQSCTEPTQIFGPDGAAPLYRRSMLEDVKIEGEYFDALFRSHKEDVDLAWRAQLFGWQSVYSPHAIAYHIRGFRPGKRVHLAAQIRRDAVKNRWLMNFKNELPLLMLQDLPYILSYELKILAYLILFEQSSLPALWDFMRLLPQMLARRRIIQGGRKRDSQTMRRWFI